MATWSRKVKLGAWQDWSSGGAPVALDGLEVIDDGDAEASSGVQHCEHNHIQRQIAKERLHMGTSLFRNATKM